MGSILMATFGVGVCFGIDAISYLAVIISLLLMRVDELLPIERKGRPPVLRGTGVGPGIQEVAAVRGACGQTAVQRSFSLWCYACARSI